MRFKAQGKKKTNMKFINEVRQLSNSIQYSKIQQAIPVWEELKLYIRLAAKSGEREIVGFDDEDVWGDENPNFNIWMRWYHAEEGVAYLAKKEGFTVRPGCIIEW